MIYLIVNREEKFCKIGYSIEPKSRLAQLQTGNPYPLELLSVIEGEIQLEKEIHERFKECRLQGEWFVLTQDILDYFKCANDGNFKTFTDYVYLIYSLKSAFEINLLFYLAGNMNSKNIIKLNGVKRKEIMSLFNKNSSYVSTKLKNLENKKLIFKTQDGYLVNPYLFWKSELHTRNQVIQKLNLDL